MNEWMMATVLLLGVLVATAGAAGDAKVSSVKMPPTEKANAFYVSNKPPLEPSPFVKLPVGAITPRGWLRRMLEIEADGMSGHLTEIAGWCAKKDNAWLSADGKGHSPWEEMPYWLKGFGDLGYVLRDERIMNEAKTWLEGILSSGQPDGWFGPIANKTRLNGKPDIWPNMLALNALQSLYEFTGDKRILPLMTNYFRWQLAVPDKDFLAPDWQKVRAGDNLESIYWLYNRTGDAFLLDVAKKVHEHTDNWTKGVANHHGVNFSQCFRQPAIYWMQAKDPMFRDAAYRNYDTFMGEFGQQPGQAMGADENARKGHTDPRQAIETCGIVEFMHSFEMLLRITGDPLWADRCEDAAFNSFPASQPPDQRGLHYLTAANQPRLDSRNHAPGYQNGGDMLSYNPRSYRCCQHNVAMGWPYYAEELWLATPDNGLCASLYAASVVEAKVGDGTAVKITEETEYPFGETITLTISAPKAVAFPLYLRIPHWCTDAKVAINGKPVEAKAEPLAFLAVEREWKDGDKLELTLPMHLAVRVWTKEHNCVSIDRGPLTYSLKIGEEWKRHGAPNDKWPAFEVFPTTPWNYGLEIDPAKPEESIQTETLQLLRTPVCPFVPEGVALVLKAKARKIPEWTYDRFALCAVLQQSPAKTAEPLETVTLIPMGCARLRICSFPTVTTGPEGTEWAAQPQAAYTATASHCNPGDTVDALCDGVLPKSSIDRGILRMTWWDHKGTAEWVAYKFPKARTLSWSNVYWFDDTGGGECRIPESWRLLYKEGNDWKPATLAANSAYAVAKDAFNKVTFEPATAAEFRLEVKLQPGFSGGILEWRVGP